MAAASLASVAATSFDPPPATGAAVPSLQAVDDFMLGFLREHKAPGAAVAIAHKGRLVYARGFGLADRDKKEPVQPDSLFRIGSISKLFTSAAVCRLVSDGKLGFTDKVFDLLKLKPPANSEFDARWKDVTVQYLLDHKGGWDREKSEDPMMRPIQVARALGVPSPPKPEQIIQHMLRRPLDFEPGSKMVYSNFGYCLLGRVIEKASGQRYDKYAIDTLLKPLRIRDTRLGRTLIAARGEVHYYDSQRTTATGAFRAQRLELVPAPYGPFSLESMDSDAGWISTAADLVRFGTAFDQLERFPAFQGPAFKGRFDPDSFHIGHLPGSSTIWRRARLSLTWAVLFNSDKSPDGKELALELNHQFQAVLDQVSEWPAEDLFPKLGYDSTGAAK